MSTTHLILERPLTDDILQIADDGETLPGGHAAVLTYHTFQNSQSDTEHVRGFATLEDAERFILEHYGKSWETLVDEAADDDEPDEPEVADPDAVAMILQRADLGTCLTVYRDGTVTTAKGHHAPEVFHSDTDDVEIDGEGWTPLTGLTGQHGYNGAVMHASEFISRGVAQAVLDAIPEGEDDIVVTAVVVDVLPTDDDPEPEPAGWAVLTRPYSTGE